MTRTLVALFLLGVLVSCEESPVVLATIDEPDGGPPHAMPARCVDSSDCKAGSFCEKHRCDDVGGQCRPFPVACPDDELPTCGCDGTTYWNDCLRRAAGVSAATSGECAEPTSCVDSDECPRGGTCARLVGADPRFCAPDARGACWVLPLACPASSGSDRWSPCEPHDPALRCVDTCMAIRSEIPHHRELRCE
jgi:hypothetical protein